MIRIPDFFLVGAPEVLHWRLVAALGKLNVRRHARRPRLRPELRAQLQAEILPSVER